MKQKQSIFSLLLERLPISTAREYVEGWDKTKAKHLFGDKYRIYIPLKLKDGKIPEPESPIKDMIERKYKLKFVDYTKGLVQDPKYPKRVAKLNKVLAPEDYAKIRKQYENDEARGSTRIQDIPIVCISRHPYDIAGQSTDRGWISCKRMMVPWRREVGKEGSETDRLHPESKHNLVTYLIRPDDRNINNPIAKLLVHAFYTKNNPIPYFVPEGIIYGDAGIWQKPYMDTVEQWLKEKQREMKLATYKIAPGVKSWELPEDIDYTDIITNQYGNDIDWIKKHLDDLDQYTIDVLFKEATNNRYEDMVELLAPLVSEYILSYKIKYAAANGYENIVRTLIPAVKNKDVLSGTLAEAARYGYENIVKLLTPVSEPKHMDSFALVLAVGAGKDRIVELLIPVSDPKAANSMALRVAIDEKHKKCVELLIPVSEPEEVEGYKPEIQALGIEV